MSITLDTQKLEEAFEGRPDLQAAIRQAAVGDNYIELFNQISSYVCDLPPASTTEPASKKRKLGGATNGSSPTEAKGKNTTNGSLSTAASGNDPILLEIKDISLVVPQRKKYTLCFTSTHIYARLPDSTEPISGISYAWKDIEYAFLFPVPEKAQKQHNYVLFPRTSCIPPSRPQPNTPSPPEPLVFTIPDSAPKPGSISGSSSADAASVSDHYKTLFHWALATHLRSAGNNIKITEADEKVFHSAIRQAHRPKEKAVHVKAFRGSKDGYLFFLPIGILWGFKKPLLFLPNDRINGVAYLSVLQRTFNLSVEVATTSTTQEGEEAEEQHEEIEFTMLDQEDYAGIDAFIKRHGLQDKSMAEQRKAKRLGINAVKGENGEVVDEGDAGELERAQAEAEQTLQDEEDEDEEDYDPGSEGESEGSGESSEEDGGEDGGEAEEGGEVEEERGEDDEGEEL